MSCSSGHFLKQGVVNIQRYYINYDSSKPMPVPFPINHSDYKIWFRDSCIIIENMAIFDHEIYGKDGEELEKMRKTDYVLEDYTYWDLRTSLSQNYDNFSDTAQPLENYKVNNYSTSAGSFVNPNADAIYKDFTMQALTDTVENNRKYRRFKLIRNIPNYSGEFIYYLDCKSPKLIFQFNRYLNKKYPGCQCVKNLIWDNNDFYYDGKHVKSVVAIDVKSKKLTTEESKIFDQWALNARLIKLPLISQDSANNAQAKRNFFKGFNKVQQRIDSLFKK